MKIGRLLFYSYLMACAAAAEADVAVSAPARADSIAQAEVPEVTAPADSVAEPGVTLDDVVITTTKKLVQSDGATLTYNVSEDPQAQSSNVIEILRKVPGVTVDAEDNVRVNGSTSFKILINNREDPMLSGDIKTVLKSMPAASIKKIEVISEPGARYDAEGVGGILNIVTDQSRRLSGFSTNYSAWLSSNNIGGNINGRVKLRNVMLGANVTYNDGTLFHRPYDYTHDTEDLTGSENHLRKEYSTGHNGWKYSSAGLNMSWEPDTLNLFTVNATYSGGTWRSDQNTSIRMFDPEGALRWEVLRDNHNRDRWINLSAQTSFQHNFRRDDHNIVASYAFEWGRTKDGNDYLSHNVEGDAGETPFSRNEETSIGRVHTLQVDYSNQIDSRHLIEAGVKGKLWQTTALTVPRMGETPETAPVVQDLVVDMKQFKDIYGVYGSYTGKYGPLGVKAGVRYEYTRTGLRYRIGDYQDFTTYFNDVVPNFALSYNFTDTRTLRLAYQMRISRPYISQLNPYVNVMTPGQISYGNPDLHSERGNFVSLGYTDYTGKLTGGAKVSYGYTSNPVNDVMFMQDGILHSTYANVGRRESVTVDLNADWNVTDAFRWSVYYSASWQYLKASSELIEAKNLGWQQYVTTNLSYTLPRKWRLSGYGGFFTPWIDLQSRGSNGYYYGLGVSKSMLKDDALTVSLSASNFLPYKNKSHYTQQDETMRYTMHQTYRQWYVGVNIGFKFGGLKSEVKRTAASIESEDMGGGQSGKGK